MKHHLFFIFLLLHFISNAQVKMNQLDSTGKKSGVWIVYLDSNWKQITDSTHAVYCRYTNYERGTNIYPMGDFSGLSLKHLDDSLSGKKTGKWVDGIYKWFSKKGVLKFEIKCKMGRMVYYKEYYDSGKLSQFFDYNDHCDTNVFSWSIFIYNSSGDLLRKDCMKPDGKGNWPRTRG